MMMMLLMLFLWSHDNHCLIAENSSVSAHLAVDRRSQPHRTVAPPHTAASHKGCYFTHIGYVSFFKVIL